MQDAETVLRIYQSRGQRGLPLEGVYRQLCNRDLYLRAYGKLYANQGALTKGSTEDTVDGMSLRKIDRLIEEIRHERYRWTPVRRVYIPKRQGKTRPLGLPSWTDKLLQEVMRSLLEAYYEPQFSRHSHGFRPHRGCHTALRTVARWGGTNWFIEGDIKGCFDNIDHEVLLTILQQSIHDNRFVRLVNNLLKAGYLEDWTYNPTLSGAPQGGIVSPIFSNIYLTRLDRFVEHVLIPRYTRGDTRTRKKSRAYVAVTNAMRCQKKKGDVDAYKDLRKQMQRMPTYDVKDPDFRRLLYVRYADDFLLGLAGPRVDAVDIKEQLRQFLRDTLRLELSEEKTLITHATTRAARFLGYEIVRFHNDTKHDRRGRRSINHRIGLYVPKDVVQKRSQLYMKGGTIMHRSELMNDTDYTIMSTYQSQYRGYVQYYALAHNIHCLNKLSWTMQISLLKTLAGKYRTSVKKMAMTYKSMVNTSTGKQRCFEVKVEREGKRPLVARFGGLPLRRQPQVQIVDHPTTLTWAPARNELIKRLLANRCELPGCGSTENCQVHHIRKLADLQVKGRREKPQWMQTMAARRRKTLVVCEKHHREIHRGTVNKALR